MGTVLTLSSLSSLLFQFPIPVISSCRVCRRAVFSSMAQRRLPLLLKKFLQATVNVVYVKKQTFVETSLALWPCAHLWLKSFSKMQLLLNVVIFKRLNTLEGWLGKFAIWLHYATYGI